MPNTYRSIDYKNKLQIAQNKYFANKNINIIYNILRNIGLKCTLKVVFRIGIIIYISGSQTVVSKRLHGGTRKVKW